MDRSELYDMMASRKDKPKDYEPYDGGNGRVNKCVNLMRAGKIRTGGILLDVGGGIGDLGYAVRDLFDECWVIDIAQTSLNAAAAKGNFVLNIDIDKEGLRHVPDADVDVVTALDFIEHIVDPENFARECYRVLKPGGVIFLNTPNFQYFEHQQSLLYRGVFPHTSGDHEVYHGGHLAFFVLDDMQNIFTSAGFKNYQQIKDEEGFRQPPDMFINFLSPKSQKEYVDCCMRLGNPNLLFLCEK